jgi:hypothetical protein
MLTADILVAQPYNVAGIICAVQWQIYGRFASEHASSM